MPRARLILALALIALLAAACGDEGEEAAPAPDLSIDRQVGYAVVVDETGGRILIGFSTDRNATSGDSYDVSQAVWRIEQGPWNEPPVDLPGGGQAAGVGHQQGAERLAARPPEEPGDLAQLPGPGRRVGAGTRRRTSATAAVTSGTSVTIEASVSSRALPGRAPAPPRRAPRR